MGCRSGRQLPRCRPRHIRGRLPVGRRARRARTDRSAGGSPASHLFARGTSAPAPVAGRECVGLARGRGREGGGNRGRGRGGGVAAPHLLVCDRRSERPLSRPSRRRQVRFPRNGLALSAGPGLRRGLAARASPSPRGRRRAETARCALPAAGAHQGVAASRCHSMPRFTARRIGTPPSSPLDGGAGESFGSSPRATLVSVVAANSSPSDGRGGGGCAARESLRCTTALPPTGGGNRRDTRRFRCARLAVRPYQAFDTRCSSRVRLAAWFRPSIWLGRSDIPPLAPPREGKRRERAADCAS